MPLLWEMLWFECKYSCSEGRIGWLKAVLSDYETFQVQNTSGNYKQKNIFHIQNSLKWNIFTCLVVVLVG